MSTHAEAQESGAKVILEELPGRGCGTFKIRMSLSKMSLEDRTKWADLFGEPLKLCDLSTVVDKFSSRTT
jgi:hypothetical protein